MDSVDSRDTIDRRRLFVLSNLAFFMIGLGFAVRANIAADLQRSLFDDLDLARSAAMVGEVIGAIFIGFALTLLPVLALIWWRDHRAGGYQPVSLTASEGGFREPA